MSVEKTTRRYQLRKRADAMEATRRRITEAALELHGTIGPARTTMTAVAERAGVVELASAMVSRAAGV